MCESQNTNALELPIHASLKKSVRSEAPPWTPTTACKSLGPAKRDVANARARHGQHSRPPPPPRQKRGPGRRWWSLTCTGVSEGLHKLKGFGTPPASSFQCDYDQAASVPCCQLHIFPLLVDASCVANDAITSEDAKRITEQNNLKHLFSLVSKEKFELVA